MRYLFSLILFAVLLSYANAQMIRSGQIWPDTDGVHINAHGGGLLEHDGVFYWYGENKSEHTSSALVGVMCYSSKDLVTWKNEGAVLKVEDDPNSEITSGCVLERPKVIYNRKTGKYVMWFHLELKGQGYSAARSAVAVSDSPTGPFKYLSSGRVNPGKYPANMSEQEIKEMNALNEDDYRTSWTPEWKKAIAKGLYTKRDLAGGQMARDMTVYVDDDGKAYHIFSSEENLTLCIAELSDDYLSHTGKYVRVAPAGHNEAPSIFRHDGKYWMITSGCTGWAPNEARMFSAKSIMGPWTQYPNPCVGPDQQLTFLGQSTYIQPIDGNKDGFIFMADIWRPQHPSDARYIWLPIQFREDGTPFIQWMDEWSLDYFRKQSSKTVEVSVANPLKIAREEELAEIDAVDLYKRLGVAINCPVVIKDESGKEIPSQITYDKKLVFPVSLKASETRKFQIAAGNPSKSKTYAIGRYHADRDDDIAWENDRTAFRLYGPEAERKDGKGYGYDIFAKRADYPILDGLYSLQLGKKYTDRVAELGRQGRKEEMKKLQDSISYHIDHGVGMDAYGVGATLGAGVTALVKKNGEMVFPYCYRKYEILDNGPLRFTVRLEFAEKNVYGRYFTEKRIITLDKGSQLNRTKVLYDGFGMKLDLACGMVVHTPEAADRQIGPALSYLSYDDPTQKPLAGNGKIRVGIVPVSPVKSAGFVPEKNAGEDVYGHLRFLADYNPGDEFTYFWGYGWSKYGYEKSSDWTSYLATFSKMVSAPLKVEIR